MKELNIILLFMVFSFCALGQNGKGYRYFDFFKLKPSERKYFKKNISYRVIESDTNIVVALNGGSEKLTLKIKKGKVAFAENVEIDCCDGTRRVLRRYFYSDSIVEFVYKFPEPYMKEGKDTMVFEAKRFITKDSIRVDVYNYGAEVSLGYDSICKVYESRKVVPKILSWKNYKVLTSFAKTYVEETISGRKGRQRGYLYCGESFIVGWWDYRRWILSKEPTMID